MLRQLLLVFPVALLAAACAGSTSSRTPAPSPLPSKATLADGEALVAVRTLPPEALSAEDLEAAGTATAAGGARIQLARAHAGGVQGWEFVSASPDGWRVWQPQAALDVLKASGGGASVVSVERVDWPDSCLGVARAEEVCAQVITTGYRIVVTRDGKQLEYHTDLRGSVRPVEQS